MMNAKSKIKVFQTKGIIEINSHRQNQRKSNCGIMKERGIGSSQFLFLHTPS